MKIRTAVLPVAGWGTRFLPATKAVPKELLPIVDRPAIQYAIEEAVASGIERVILVTSEHKRAIEDHFDNAFELEMQLSGTSKEHYLKEVKEIIKKSTFTYVRQKQMLGLGHAILTGEPLIGDEPFAVILADDLCYSDENGVISQLINIHSQYKCSVIAIEEVSMDQTSKYGIITGNLVDNSNNTYQVSDMVEKPEEKSALSNMAIIGRYILTPDIFNILKNIKPDNNGEIQITDALLVQAKQAKVIAYKFKGRRFDCGSVKGYLEATNYFANKLSINI